MRTLLFVLAACSAFSFLPIHEGTILQGRVADDKGDPLIGATIKVLNGTDVVRGAISDYDGNYRISLDPGTYDVEVAYTGFSNQRTSGVKVLAGKINTLDFELGATVLSEVVIKEHKVPLIEQDNTSSGATLSSEQMRRMPTRSVNAISATKAGGKANRKKVKSNAATPGSSSVDGGAINVRGNRENAQTYYIDGIRVSGTTPPVSADTKRTKKDKQQAAKVTPPVTPPDNTPEHYSAIHENEFLKAGETPVSTFSIDVDGASFANSRRFINQGTLPPADAVRIEEFINYFDYEYEQPKGQHPFAMHTELSACPWNQENRLLMIGLQGLEIDEGQLPPSNLVFLVDVSGSMSAANKLELVKKSLELLTDHLRPQDRVALVTYAGAAGMVLPSTPGNQKTQIKNAIQNLSSGGSTAGAAGIQLAYNTARANFAKGGNNRVILCTDGDFNVGVSSEEALVSLIEQERESGVYLTVLGYGMGNYQDSKMQMLANKGNGNHAYIDQLSEAQKVLINEFGGTLFTIAKDVKIQIEFNPAKVASYRLIGYENRMLKKEDFDDDTKDAGELGSGHRVTALYEIVPVSAGQGLTAAEQRALIGEGATTGGEDLLKIKFRYKQPKKNASSMLIEAVVKDELVKTPSANFQLAAGAASFGLVLRNSKFKGNANYELAKRLVSESLSIDPNGYRKDLRDLITAAAILDTRP
jgi:Ca-activated chloride channel family protein